MAEKELEKCMNEMDIKRIGDFLLEKRADWIVQKKNPPMASHIPPPPPHFFKGGGWTFSKLAKRMGFNFFNKGSDRKKGWDDVIRGDKENLQNFFNFFKGNSNFQGILN